MEAFKQLGQGFGPASLGTGSVIIYVWRKRDAESLAEYLAGSGVEGGIVFYHGGMSSRDREIAQGKVCHLFFAATKLKVAILLSDTLTCFTVEMSDLLCNDIFAWSGATLVYSRQSSHLRCNGRIWTWH